MQQGTRSIRARAINQFPAIFCRFVDYSFDLLKVNSRERKIRSEWSAPSPNVTAGNLQQESVLFGFGSYLVIVTGLPRVLAR